MIFRVFLEKNQKTSYNTKYRGMWNYVRLLGGI